MILQENVSLKNYNSFGIDVKTKKLVEIENETEFQDLLSMLRSEKNTFFLGEGCNVLFSHDFDGTIIRYVGKNSEVFAKEGEQILIEASAGLNWDNFVEQSISAGHFGLENLSHIPGSVGSSPVQNIGAYGSEVKNFIEKVFCLDISNGEKIIFNQEECKFGYRDSIFKKNKHLFIYKVLYKLNSIENLNVCYNSLQKYIEEKNITIKSATDIRDAVIAIRSSKLPDHKILGNAGSFFKNPLITKAFYEELIKKYPDMPHYADKNNMVKIPAAYLIEKSGWKGKRKGNVGVHDKQALVLVNYGGGSGQDIMNLAKSIISDIKNNFGVEIYPEVATI